LTKLKKLVGYEGGGKYFLFLCAQAALTQYIAYVICFDLAKEASAHFYQF